MESVNFSNEKVKKNPKKGTKSKITKKNEEKEEPIMRKATDMDITLNGEEKDNSMVKPTRTRRQRNSHRFTVIKGEKPGTDEVEMLQASSEEEDFDNIRSFRSSYRLCFCSDCWR